MSLLMAAVDLYTHVWRLLTLQVSAPSAASTEDGRTPTDQTDACTFQPIRTEDGQVAAGGGTNKQTEDLLLIHVILLCASTQQRAGNC